ncbi:hypothetical protein RUM44_002842 [Polyplax serrata]|uniref:Leucine-rich repeat flightless-interacting protein 2 n=1 Tax=Polyplax serrata TaxID=468196 RepID=A0ABR1AFX6_POLSC
MENCAAVNGRKRGATKHSVEDQALDQIAKEGGKPKIPRNTICVYVREMGHKKFSSRCDIRGQTGHFHQNGQAEARLSARRQARVEAREIRLRELERQQREQEENADKMFDMSHGSENALRSGARAFAGVSVNSKDRPSAFVNNYYSSRRSSEDSLEDSSYCLRDVKHEMKELDEKFRKAMIANAQLDNEKSELSYQVELLKDNLEDLEESHNQLLRENREKCREHEQLKRVTVKLRDDLSLYKSQLEERDRLITNCGLVIVGGDEGENSSEKALVSAGTAEALQQAGTGSLDVRLKKIVDERNELFDEVRHLKLELEEEKNKKRSDTKSGLTMNNGPLDEETCKILSDYRFKLQKAEQDVSTLQATVARLESQVIRYKSAAETSEKAEDELKIEKRKLQRENRESIARIEELETANSHLQRRMDKLKNAKSTLLKEL